MDQETSDPWIAAKNNNGNVIKLCCVPINHDVQWFKKHFTIQDGNWTVNDLHSYLMGEGKGTDEAYDRAMSII